MTLFHITKRTELTQAQATGHYTPQGYAAEGFIHCSYSQQVVATANRIFKGQSDLVLLEIDPTQLQCNVIDENLEGGTELFPHIYGELPLTTVKKVHDFPCDAEGLFQLPRSL